MPEDQTNPAVPKPEVPVAVPVKAPKPPLGTRLKALIRRHPLRSIAALLLVAAALVVGFTDLKYLVAGMVVRTKVQATIVDPEINQPISDATVTIGRASGTSDKDGKVTLNDVWPGNQNIEVTKKAYKTTTLHKKLGFRTNDLGTINLELSGIRVSFVVKDKVSGAPVSDARITVGGNTTTTDTAGKATTSVEQSDATAASATVSKDSYLEVKLSVTLKRGQPAFGVSLVPAGKVYYLTNRNRRIDLMRSNLDGSGEVLVLAGTGAEDQETGILPDINQANLIALVSSRAGRQDSFGDPKHDLFVVNGDTKNITLLDKDVAFGNFRAWLGGYLVYEVFTPTGGKLKSYNASTGQTSTIATASAPANMSINLVNKDKVYYSIDNGASSINGLYVVEANGQGRRRLSPTPIDSVVIQDKAHVVYRHYNYADVSPVSWRNLNLTNDQVTSLTHGPSATENYGYADSPDKRFSAFIDERDGRSELYLVNFDGTNERRLTNGAKVSQFVQWYGDKYIVFTTTSDENSLYIVSVSGGKPVKIADFYKGNGRVYGGGGYNPYY